jgi:hypothetical protein
VTGVQTCALPISQAVSMMVLKSIIGLFLHHIMLHHIIAIVTTYFIPSSQVRPIATQPTRTPKSLNLPSSYGIYSMSLHYCCSSCSGALNDEVPKILVNVVQEMVYNVFNRHDASTIPGIHWERALWYFVQERSTDTIRN